MLIKSYLIPQLIKFPIYFNCNYYEDLTWAFSLSGSFGLVDIGVVDVTADDVSDIVAGNETLTDDIGKHREIREVWVVEKP